EQQVAARVELLDAVVAGVGDEDGARFADREPLRPAEPPRLLAETAPAAEWLALRANLVDRVLLEDCQIERAVWPRRDARRNVEYRLAVRPSNGRQLNAVRPENGHRMATGVGNVDAAGRRFEGRVRGRPGSWPVLRRRWSGNRGGRFQGRGSGCGARCRCGRGRRRRRRY